jgi:hypothetical protein
LRGPGMMAAIAGWGKTKLFASNLNCGLQDTRLFFGGHVERLPSRASVTAALSGETRPHVGA